VIANQSLALQHKRIIYALMAVLFLFLLLMDVMVMTNQRAVMIRQHNNRTENELAILGQFITEALIKSDYITVEVFMANWAKHRDDIIEASITIDNGFVLAKYKSNKPSTMGSQHRHTINYATDRSATILLDTDLTQLNEQIQSLASKLVLASLLLVTILGFILWKVLKVIAITPLEQQIAERENTAQILREHAADLKAVNDELEAFSYSVSHDLRAPLRAIDGFSLALQEDYVDQLDETANNYLSRIRHGAQRMSTLIDEMLQLSRITRHGLRKEKIDLTQLVHDINDKYRGLESHRQVAVTIDKNMYCFGDKFLITQMIDNLISNAWKYTSRTPSATLHIGKELIDETDVFFVRDNGVGFDMKFSGKLFGVFQRLHSEKEFEGTGVGLATVRRIIQRHDGRIWADSEVGKGATFYFSFAKHLQYNAKNNVQT